jgi:hypothetical protein
MPALETLQQFDFDGAIIEAWLFKKSTNGAVRFGARWIDTDEDLDGALKDAIKAKVENVLEVNDYSLLASAGDGVALHVDALQTSAGAITAASANPTAGRKIRRVSDIQNTKFYVIKLVCGGQVIHAVRKTDATWQSKKAHNSLLVYYADDQLGLNENPGFSISRDIDFFIVGDDILITNKAAFESVLSYKEAHEEDFEALQGEHSFSSLFTTLDPLVAFVGTNKLHLRRACAIHQKAHYRDAAFMQRLRNLHAQCGLNLNFDDQGRIVPTPETCADIIRALLDHRLSSVFSQRNYDVPDATVVA